MSSDLLTTQRFYKDIFSQEDGKSFFVPSNNTSKHVTIWKISSFFHKIKICSQVGFRNTVIHTRTLGFWRSSCPVDSHLFLEMLNFNEVWNMSEQIEAWVWRIICDTKQVLNNIHCGLFIWVCYSPCKARRNLHVFYRQREKLVLHPVWFML